MRVHWRTLLAVEELAHSDADYQSVLGAIGWTDWAPVRLLLTANELEGTTGECTRYLLQNIHMRLPDEKCAKYQHQHVRDKRRSQRYKNIAATRIMRTIVDADIPKARGLDSVQISDYDIAEGIRYDESQKRVAHKFVSHPSEIPD